MLYNVLYQLNIAGMVELVDTADLKSAAVTACRFESDYPHQVLIAISGGLTSARLLILLVTTTRVGV